MENQSRPGDIIRNAERRGGNRRKLFRAVTSILPGIGPAGLLLHKYMSCITS